MSKVTLKSIAAIILPFITVFILSILTDIVLSRIGFMTMDPFSANSPAIIAIVIIYRSIYNIGGCYLAAWLAPTRPMRYAMIVGIIGLIFSITGTIVMWDKSPHWYPITLTILVMPCAWLGGKLQELFKKA